jgi:serine protease inhibitor
MGNGATQTEMDSEYVNGGLRMKNTAMLFGTVIVMLCVLPQPQASSNEWDIIHCNNAHAIDMYSWCAKQDANVICSPYSAYEALGMVYAGARGKTAYEMAKGLYLPDVSEVVGREFADLSKRLSFEIPEVGSELLVANALWGQKGFKFKNDYLDHISSDYLGEFRVVDFANELETARVEINTWAEEKTRGKIPTLLEQNDLTPAARLVLTNTLYLKARWKEQFKAKLTTDEPFYLDKNDYVRVPMMQITERYSYFENDLVQILEMPYYDCDLAMDIILPWEVSALPELEASISADLLHEWFEEFEEKRVEVSIPKFKFKMRSNLVRFLQSRGVERAFDGRADLSGIASGDLFISNVIHESCIEVDEEGTTAAGATAIVITLGIHVPPPDQPVFRADHPFIFVIRHVTSGAILFIGRLVDPLE